MKKRFEKNGIIVKKWGGMWHVEHLGEKVGSRTTQAAANAIANAYLAKLRAKA